MLLDIQALLAFRDWMQEYVTWAGSANAEEQYTLYREYRDFWIALPGLVWAQTSPYK